MTTASNMDSCVIISLDKWLHVMVRVLAITCMHGWQPLHLYICTYNMFLTRVVGSCSYIQHYTTPLDTIGWCECLVTSCNVTAGCAIPCSVCWYVSHLAIPKPICFPSAVDLVGHVLAFIFRTQPSSSNSISNAVTNIETRTLHYIITFNTWTKIIVTWAVFKAICCSCILPGQ